MCTKRGGSISKPEPVFEVLSECAQLDPLTRDFVGDEAFEWLRSVGLIVSHPRLELLGREGFSVVPAIASVLNRAGAPDGESRLANAAAWYERLSATGTMSSALDDDGLVARQHPTRARHRF